MIVKKNKKIGICSPSWSGPGEYPHVFCYGVAQMKKIFGMEVVISKNAKRKGFVSFEDRASDINSLFSDKSVGIICASIGGDDSVNVIPFLDKKKIENNKDKVFMGFSDTTSLLLYLYYKYGIITVHGPSVMAGFAEPSGVDLNMIKNIKDIFFSNKKSLEYKDPLVYSDENNNWDSENDFLNFNISFKKYEGWQVSNGGRVTGIIVGGSLETLKRMKQTRFFPLNLNFWNGKILFLETSEEKPSLDFIKKELFDYHKKGILKELKGLLFGQIAYRSLSEKKYFIKEISNYIIKTLGYKKIFLVQNLNFGHIRPQWPLVLGGVVEIDTLKHSFKYKR